MRIETVEKLCCPFDKKDLILEVVQQSENGEVVNGVLVCSTCKKVFPIVYGIPILAPDEYRDFKLEKPLLDRFKQQLGTETVKKLGFGN